MLISRQGRAQLLHHRQRAALLAEELAAHVVVHSDDVPAFVVQQADTLRADQPAGTGDDGFLRGHVESFQPRGSEFCETSASNSSSRPASARSEPCSFLWSPPKGA